MSTFDNVIAMPGARHTLAGPVSERRRDLRGVLAALVANLTHGAGERDLPGLFEQQVQQLLSMRSVRLREMPARYQARLVTPTRTADSLVLAVPRVDARVQAVLEVSFESGRTLETEEVDVLTSAAQLAGLVLEAARTRAAQRPTSDDTVPLVGSSTVMQHLRDRVARVALTDFTVLIEGESGCGKELVARQLHDLGRRRHGPFVAVNCAAVVETLLEAELFGIEDRTASGVRGRKGKFEHADQGTLFLDEVSDLSPTAQAKLLRAIQDLSVERVGGTGAKRVNTRIVAATNRPLGDMVARGQFRGDLFYRLSGVEVHVPPLRTRREDIGELAAHFLARHRQARELRLSLPALEALRAHAWPGNVRELERLIERAVALAEGDEIVLDDLPPHVRGEFGEVLEPSLVAEHSMRAWGSRYVRLVYERNGRNKRRACRLLDISYHTLQAYLRYAEADARPVPRQIPRWARREGGAPAAVAPSGVLG